MKPVILDKMGRITIPIEIRQELGLKTGQLLGVEITNREITVRKAKLVPEEDGEK